MFIKTHQLALAELISAESSPKEALKTIYNVDEIRTKEILDTSKSSLSGLRG